MAKRGRPAGISGGQAVALNRSQVRTLLNFTRGGHDGTRRAAFLELLLSGLRVSEPLVLEAGMVLNLRGEVQDTFVINGTHMKNGKSRRVFLTKSAQKAIAALINELGAVERETRLFPWTPNYATTMVKRLMLEAGLPSSCSSHSLRRTCAETLQGLGISVPHISQVLSHSSIAVTARYLDTSTSNVRNAVAVLSW
jgi:integrase/recombinase XerD